jgi:hypothetical protein
MRGFGQGIKLKRDWVKNYSTPQMESLNPDLSHPSPKKPHWDYDG